MDWTLAALWMKTRPCMDFDPTAWFKKLQNWTSCELASICEWKQNWQVDPDYVVRTEIALGQYLCGPKNPTDLWTQLLIANESQTVQVDPDYGVKSWTASRWDLCDKEIVQTCRLLDPLVTQERKRNQTNQKETILGNSRKEKIPGKSRNEMIPSKIGKEKIPSKWTYTWRTRKGKENWPRNHEIGLMHIAR